jgi:hypothetical protein
VTAFFQVGPDGHGPPVPWIARIEGGLRLSPPCPGCGVASERPCGDVAAVLDDDRPTTWPDVVGCGAWPLLVVSERALSAFEAAGVEVRRGGRVRFAPPVPASLPRPVPRYGWVDGAAHLGARVDFEASGFANVAFCPSCGRRTEDVAETYRLQHEAVVPTRLVPGSWDGSDLFTTDLSPAAFFATERFVAAAARAAVTNLRVVPLERGPHGEALRLA